MAGTGSSSISRQDFTDYGQGLLAVGGFIAADYSANKANKASASALRKQAGVYGAMSGNSLVTASMYSGQAAAYSKQAGMSARLGEANARKLRLAAANLDPYEQLALRNATVEARQRVGAGRVQFAANGVMVDTGAAALWEQDEAADAALERLDIMQQYEDQSWEYRTQANKALAEGYAAAAGAAASAAGQAGAAMGAAGDAYAYSLQQAAALAEAKQKQKKKRGGIIGSVLGGVAGAVIGTFCGGNTAAGFMIGSSLGGAVGTAVDS